MKNLKSPNIIQFLEVHETANNVYIIQEIAEDGTIKDIIKSHKNGLDEEIAKEYIMQLVNGFGELSKNGIIHRDVKPTNILVKNNVLKLADFGFSRHSDSMSSMNSTVGTPAYMAPQVLNRKVFPQYTYKCDIWSFGVVCFEILTGKLPWKIAKITNEEELFSEIKQISESGLKFPNKQISEPMKNLIRGCLRYEEKERLDWTQIFQHQVFSGNFNDNLDSDQLSIEEAFAFTKLRMSVHSQNLNLSKILNKMPQNLNRPDFGVLVKMIDPSISEDEIECIFKVASKNGDVSQQNFMTHLKKHGIKLSGLKLSAVKKKETEMGGEIEAIIEELAVIIDEKDIDLHDLFKKYDKRKINGLSKQQFEEMIKSINPKLTPPELQKMFVLFDSDSSNSISFNECYAKLCKMVQTINVQDKDLKESIRKVQNKKKN